MTINRRRAPSSKISSDKKIRGHKNEKDFASLIQGEVIKGTQKGDVRDKSGKLHSVKSGKKWQIFLYSFDRITQSSHLNILKPCLESFPDDYDQYLKDRISCISHKENFIKEHSRDAAKLLSNKDVSDSLGDNLYIKSKNTLKENTENICNKLQDKDILKKFYNEAIFNNDEVEFLTAKEDNTNKNDGLFKVYAKDDVLNILTKTTFPSVSKAGRVPEDFNVDGQKVLLRYEKKPNKFKNIIEIEIRNDSKIKYRLTRFNMYSKDTLYLLKELSSKKLNNSIRTYGQAIEKFTLDI